MLLRHSDLCMVQMVSVGLKGTLDPSGRIPSKSGLKIKTINRELTGQI